MTIGRWIFVTGSPRSATTFVGRVLAAPLGADYIHEPFNPDCGVLPRDGSPGAERLYPYVREGGRDQARFDETFRRILRYDFDLRTGYYRNDTTLRRLIKRVVGSRGPFHLRLAKLNPFHRIAVLKDPTGCLLPEYLAARFGVRPVVLVRHPVPFVASALRLGWRLDLAPLRAQPDLVGDHFADEPGFLESDCSDPLEGAALLWRALNKVLLAQARRHPEWPLVTHEALCEQPVAVFRALHEGLDLPWTAGVERRVRRWTAPGNRIDAARGRVQDFKRNSAGLFQRRLLDLTAEQRRRVHAITAVVAEPLYAAETFHLHAGPAPSGTPAS